MVVLRQTTGELELLEGNSLRKEGKDLAAAMRKAFDWCMLVKRFEQS